MHAPNSFTRIVIEDVYPELDHGRFLLRRVEGDVLDLWADIFMDGHDHLAAEVLVARIGERRPERLPMQPIGNDRYHVQIPFDAPGRYQVTIQAWPDLFATWQADTRKKKEAGQDIALELQEALLLLDALFKGAKAERRKAYQALSKRLGDAPSYKALTDPELTQLVAQHALHAGMVSHTLLVWVERKRAEFSAWYEMFPRSQGTAHDVSGTFRDCIDRLPDIRAMGSMWSIFPRSILSASPIARGAITALRRTPTILAVLMQSAARKAGIKRSIPSSARSPISARS